MGKFKLGDTRHERGDERGDYTSNRGWDYTSNRGDFRALIASQNEIIELLKTTIDAQHKTIKRLTLRDRIKSSELNRLRSIRK